MSHHPGHDLGAIVHRSGVHFGVWAPNAKTVSVIGNFSDWQPIAMEPENGYWHVDVKDAAAGQEYKFVIDSGNGSTTKNDPRALQVTTSEGNSVIADPDFDWGDDHFTPPTFNNQVIYELHVGTFSRQDAATIGTFEEATAKLDYLASLGVNMIELMPVCSMFMDRGWGYAPEYPFSVESLYGGRHQLLEFIKAAHSKGIGVILDVVYNHFGAGKDMALWQFDGWSQDNKGGIYFYNDWRSVTPWGDTRPDYSRPEVRQFIIDNVRMWLKDFRLDGLRVDSTIFTRNVKGFNNDPATDLPDGWLVLQELTTTAHKINPNAIMIAEDVSGNDYITKPRGDGGAGFYSQWELGLPRVLRDVLDAVDDKSRSLTNVCVQLGKRFNSDTFQSVVFSDSHDCAANGAARLNQEISPNNPTSVFARKRALLAAAIVLTSPGIPMILQGQEFMEGGSFNDWQALDWKKADKFNGIVLAYTHLIALRKNTYGFSRGLTGQSIAILNADEDKKVLAYHRWEFGGAGDDVIVVLNFTNQAISDYGIKFPRTGIWKQRFNSSWQGYSPDFKELNVGEIKVETDYATLSLPPYSVLIFSQDQ